MVSRYLQDNASIFLYPVPSYLHIIRQLMATWQTPLVIWQIAPIIYDYGIFGYHCCLILGMGDCNTINNDNHNHLYETESFHYPLAVRYTHTQAHTWISRHTNKCSCSHVHSHRFKSTFWCKNVWSVSISGYSLWSWCLVKPQNCVVYIAEKQLNISLLTAPSTLR